MASKRDDTVNPPQAGAPAAPSPAEALEADYTLLYSEDIPEDEDEESEDGEGGKGEGGEGHAALAFDTPEPAAALAAAESPAGKGKNARDPKARKAKRGARSTLGKNFAEESTRTGDGASTAIAITLDDQMFGLEPESDAVAPDGAETEEGLSAFDRDEITDIDPDDLDPLTMLLGATEKPWENEKLNPAEQAARDRVLRTARPGAEDSANEEKDARHRDGKQGHPVARAAGLAAIAGAGILAARQAQAKTATQKAHPGLAGLARGPNARAMGLESNRIQSGEDSKNNTQSQGANPARKMRYQAYDYEGNSPEKTAEKTDDGHALAMGIGTMIGLPTASAVLYSTGEKQAGPQGGLSYLQQMNALDLAAPAFPEPEPEPGTASQNPPPRQKGATPFMQTLHTLYDMIGLQSLMDIPAYRQAGWAEKRTEQQQNAKDVTATAPQGLKNTAPDPNLNRVPLPQINISGPNGL